MVAQTQSSRRSADIPHAKLLVLPALGYVFQVEKLLACYRNVISSYLNMGQQTILDYDQFCFWLGREDHSGLERRRAASRGYAAESIRREREIHG